jgi:RNA polymerase sigma factor (sigma-70 family)
MCTNDDTQNLVEAARRGDAAAWNRLVITWTPTLSAVARRTGVRACDVDDAVQATWINAFKYLDALSRPDALRGWLTAITRREALRILRSSARELPIATTPHEAADDGPSPDQAISAEERASAVRAAAERLPGRQRSVVLALLMNPSACYTAMARELSLPIGSIGPTRGRAIERLRADLELVAALSSCAMAP